MTADRVGRRDFIFEGLKSLIRPLVQGLSDPVQEMGGAGPLRPPGALDEAAFILTCQRCGTCARSCPYRSIKFMGDAGGGALGTPYVDPASAPCYWCLECTKQCPSGALSMAEGEPLSIGLAVIDYNRCLSVRGQACDFCVERCPKKGTAIAFSDGHPVITAEECTGCAICAHFCPATPGAIAVRTRRRTGPRRESPS